MSEEVEISDDYMKRTQFELERTFAASPERVFAAWTTPDDLCRWLWASLGKNVWAEVDVRVGGAYRVYSEVDGGLHQGDGWSGMCGIYVDVDPGRRLAFTLHWDANVGYNGPDALTLDEVMVVTFTPVDGGTHMTLAHLGIPDDGRSMPEHRAGVAESLEMLAALVEV